MSNFFTDILNKSKEPKKLELDKNYKEIISLIYDILNSMEISAPQLPVRFCQYKIEDTIYIYDSLKNVLCSQDNIKAALFEAVDAVKLKNLFEKRLNKIDRQLKKANDTDKILDNLNHLSEEIKYLNKEIESLKNNQIQK